MRRQMIAKNEEKADWFGLHKSLMLRSRIPGCLRCGTWICGTVLVEERTWPASMAKLLSEFVGGSAMRARAQTLCVLYLRRYGSWSLGDFALKFIVDVFPRAVGIGRALAILFGWYVAVKLEQVAVGIVEIDALGDAVKNRVADLDVLLLQSFI